jgi:hypothetical protein
VGLLVVFKARKRGGSNLVFFISSETTETSSSKKPQIIYQHNLSSKSQIQYDMLA